MKHIAAYAMLVLGGNPNPTKEDVENVLKEVGIKPNGEALDNLISALRGKPLHTVI